MTLFEIAKILVAFLGGGLAGGLINWYRSNQSEKSQRRNSVLNDQLINLYGPLFYLTAQAQALFDLSRKFSVAHEAEYFGKTHYSRDDLNASIDISNSYAQRVIELGREAVDLLNKQYAHIDPEDNPIMQAFVIDTLRLEHEREESGKMRVPIEIYSRVGDMHYMHSDFIELIAKRFTEKRLELEQLTK